jgi:hypothetical protein
MRFIFDLDGTVIDSAHRQGETLADWRRMNTVGNIMRDGLLPLAGKMQGAILDGLDVWVCTSRVMGKADFAFLRLQGLLPNGGPVIHRIGENDQRPCGELKLAKLRGYAAGMGITWAQFAHDSIMFDDSLDVQKTLRGAGIRVIDPVQFNTYIARKIA